jgi:hypothetical protein
MKYDRTARDLSAIPEKTLKILLDRYARRLQIVQGRDQLAQAKAEAVAGELGFRHTIGEIIDDANSVENERHPLILDTTQ